MDRIRFIVADDHPLFLDGVVVALSATEDMEVAGPSTPAQSQFRQRLGFGSLWTFGLKGTF